MATSTASFDDGDTFLLYYRRDLFDDPDQAAFEEKTLPLAPPATWEEYDEVQAFFTEQGWRRVLGRRQPARPLQVYQLVDVEFRTRGGKFFDEETMDATLDSQAGIDTLNPDAGLERDDAAGVEEWDFTRGFRELDGRALAMVGGTWPPFGRFSERYGADTVQMEWLPPSEVADNVGYAGCPRLQRPRFRHSCCACRRQPKQGCRLPLRAVDEQPDHQPGAGDAPLYPARSVPAQPLQSEAYRGAEARRPASTWTCCKEQTDNALLDIIMPGSQEYHTAIEQMWGAVQGGTPAEQARPTPTRRLTPSPTALAGMRSARRTRRTWSSGTSTRTHSLSVYLKPSPQPNPPSR